MRAAALCHLAGGRLRAVDRVTLDRPERFQLDTPAGVIELPGTLKPNRLGPEEPPQNLVRAYGYREQYDLMDGLPPPGSLVLTGFVSADDEAQLSLLIRELRRSVRTATRYNRDGRIWRDLLRATLSATPDGDDSNNAGIVIRLTPVQVEGPDDLVDPYDF